MYRLKEALEADCQLTSIAWYTLLIVYQLVLVLPPLRVTVAPDLVAAAAAPKLHPEDNLAAGIDAHKDILRRRTDGYVVWVEVEALR